MESNFVVALERVLAHEGGFSDHPSDPGGATMKGVTIAVFRRHYGEDRTVEDLKNINTEQIQHIYKTGYWDKCDCDKLPGGVDYGVFDAAVNSGPGRGGRWLQGAVGADQDGIVGPDTLKAVSEHNTLDVIEDMCDLRMVFLKRLATWPVFGKGWTRRVREVRAVASAMAKDQDPSVAWVTPSNTFETVRKGSTGDWVTKLQSALNVTADGIFGDYTDKILRVWQARHGLEADGIAGRNTYRAMGLLG